MAKKLILFKKKPITTKEFKEKIKKIQSNPLKPKKKYA